MDTIQVDLQDSIYLEKQIRIRDLASELRELIDDLETPDQKIESINYVRSELHSVSPLKHHPVDCVLWKKSDKVEPNEYNPNSIAPPEQISLHQSIAASGYTMPVVTWNDPEGSIKIVDGFHRRLMEQIHEDISSSTMGYLPITFVRDSDSGKSERMAATILHNRARGSHNIELMSTIVQELVEMGKGDPWICKHVGMSIDELLRLKQITGLASLFTNKDFSESWEVGND